MTDDFSLASPAGHLIMGDSSGPDGLATKDGAKALSRAGSVDTATTQLNTPSRTKNLIIEFKAFFLSCWPISARAVQSPSLSRRRPLIWLRRILFSVTRYSLCRSSY